MHALVTGAAGFIGSSLAEDLLMSGYRVRGVDCFTPYYSAELKRDNLAGLPRDEFEVVEADLRSCDLGPLLDGIDTVFHLAAQPGVRLSWAEHFSDYADHNIRVTQRLLEGVRARQIHRFVFASSSSVYGNAARCPTREDSRLRPHSPYGVTKAAAEQLCTVYADNWETPTVMLRYFTVYGPRQRPDMAIHRLVNAAMNRTPFPLFGTGEQVRDFTYVDDVVRATRLAATADIAPGTVINVAGGSSTTMRKLIDLVGDVCGVKVEVVHLPAQAGDVDRTGGSIGSARTLLGWRPEVGLRAGVEIQTCWQRSLRGQPTLARLV
jgi:nucleoside-diphosphate-sugar epimerase